MIPLRDENPLHSTPIVTRVLIIVNLAVFLYEIVLGPDLRAFMMEWGLVPRRLTGAFVSGDEALTSGLATVVTSMFLHGGWAHLLGNMWYLWIFGDNVEDRLGRVRFLVFYTASGAFAGFAHYFTNTHSALPTVGASGAIAGVLGAYLAAFPGARVVTLIPFFPFFQIATLPSAVVLGFWFVYQFFAGALALAWSPQGGGVAWWAHIGGFAFGWLVMRIAGGRPERPERGRWREHD